jgi:hypothetical protein
MQRLALGLGSVLLACAPNEAPRVELPVVVDGTALTTSTTDLGWTIEFEQARLAIADLQFTSAGEVESARQPSGAWLMSVLLPTAHAHPGHEESGQILGELFGSFVLDFVDGDGVELGLATLIVGEYTAANFRFRRASADELPEGDPLIGHTALLTGTASKAEQVIAFSIAIDSPLDRQLIGAPFESEVSEQSMVALGVQLLDTDPYAGKHLFDGIDFAALDTADGVDDGMVALIDPELDPALPSALVDAYNQVRADFQTHDVFAVESREP